jgi:hypothetical protein
LLDGFGDADSGTFENSSWFEIVLNNVEVGFARRGHVFAVVADSRDGESLGEASGSGGEEFEFGERNSSPPFRCARRVGHDLGRELEVAEAGHVGESDEGFESAEENASGLAIREAGDVETEVGSVNEVDIDEPGRAKQNGIAKGASTG